MVRSMAEGARKDKTELVAELRVFVVENFLFGVDDPGLTDTASFLESGVIDSTGILELVGFVEKRYQLRVADDEMIPENLDSLANVATYIAGKTDA